MAEQAGGRRADIRHVDFFVLLPEPLDILELQAEREKRTRKIFDKI